MARDTDPDLDDDLVTPPGSTTIQISKTDRVRLGDVRAEMVTEKRHNLTVGETVGYLIDFWREHHDNP